MPSLSEQPSLCNNRLLALIWRCLIVVICCYGLYPMFFGAPFSGQILCYFTTQSNLLVAGMFLVLAIGTLQQLRKSGARGQVYSLWPPLQLAVVFFIQITFLVFAFVLSRTMFSMGRGIGLSNLLLHYVVPIMALIDWVLFMPHGAVNYRHAALWLAYPAAYMAFSFIRAELGQPFYNGSRYPYFFMDFDLQGWNLLWICPLFFAGFFLLGCLVVYFDRALAKRRGGVRREKADVAC